MESITSFRKSSLLLTDAQRSHAPEWISRGGWIQVSRFEKEAKAFKTCSHWEKKYNPLATHNRTHVSRTLHSRGDIHCKAEYSSGDASRQASSVAIPPPFPPPQPQIGSPLLWIGVGVGISIVFSWAARRVQGYAMQQALKSMMQQTGQGGNFFGSGPGSPSFSGPGLNLFEGLASGTFPGSPTSPASSAATATVDVTAQEVSPLKSEVQVAMDKPSERKHEAQVATDKPSESKKSAFTDVDVNLLAREEPQVQEQSSDRTFIREPQVLDGAVGFSGTTTSGSEASSSGTGGNGKSFISIEMLETMLDDPKIQQMVFPYLPAELRDPATFKQMIQLPQVRQQLQEALNNMGGEDGLDMLKYMNSDVVKQQFEQIGMKPEEVVGKILASPDIAASLQNPKVVEAIMDCSQNPLNITKYQNDKEVMNALMKIAELFPGASGSPF